MTNLDQVRHAWAATLDIDPEAVPLDVSFFDAGGNSLLLLLLWEMLNENTARDLRAADLFEHSTVVAQAEFLAGTDDRVAVVTTSRLALLGRVRRETP